MTRNIFQERDGYTGTNFATWNHDDLFYAVTDWFLTPRQIHSLCIQIANNNDDLASFKDYLFANPAGAAEFFRELLAQEIYDIEPIEA